MRIEDIHWHDAVLLGVTLATDTDTLKLKLSYPVDWESGKFENRTLEFRDAHGYKEFEGPFSGAPTILSASVVAERQPWKLLRIETNAGYREVFFKEIAFV